MSVISAIHYQHHDQLVADLVAKTLVAASVNKYLINVLNICKTLLATFRLSNLYFSYCHLYVDKHSLGMLGIYRSLFVSVFLCLSTGIFGKGYLGRGLTEGDEIL